MVAVEQQQSDVLTYVMPVYMGEAFVVEAIDSLLAQDAPNWRLIAVDDASPDGSAELIASYDDDRIKLVRLERNHGQAAALNEGLKFVLTKYVARIDQDDIAAPERTAVTLDFLNRNPDVILVGSWFWHINNDGRVIGVSTPPEDNESLRRIFVRHPVLNPFAHSAVVFRSDVVRELGGYNESLRIALDYELWVRFVARGRVAVIQQHLCSVRRHDAQATAGKSSIFGLREVLESTRDMDVLFDMTVSDRAKWRRGRAEAAFEGCGVMLVTLRDWTFFRKHFLYFLGQVFRGPSFFLSTPRLTRRALRNRSSNVSGVILNPFRPDDESRLLE